MVLNIHSEFDVIVVGAGIAGSCVVHLGLLFDARSELILPVVPPLLLSSALGYSLAISGRRVLVVERDMATPDRIVGELLQPGGCASLRALGMGDCLEGIDAIPTEGYCTRVSCSPQTVGDYVAAVKTTGRVSRSCCPLADSPPLLNPLIRLAVRRRRGSDPVPSESSRPGQGGRSDGIGQGRGSSFRSRQVHRCAQAEGKQCCQLSVGRRYVRFLCRFNPEHTSDCR